MISKSPASPNSSFDSQLWISVGFPLGMGIGAVVHDIGFGVAIGLMSGGVVALLVERRKKATSRLIVAVGILALVTTIGTVTCDATVLIRAAAFTCPQ